MSFSFSATTADKEDILSQDKEAGGRKYPNPFGEKNLQVSQIVASVPVGEEGEDRPVCMTVHNEQRARLALRRTRFN